MNLYPGHSIDVGVTRTPAPAPAALQPAVVQGLVFGPSATGPTVRLDADFFANRERTLALVAHWTRDELYAVGNLFVEEGDRRVEADLLRLLRDEYAGPTGSPRVTHIEFETTSEPDGVYWSHRTAYAHLAGRPAPVEVDLADPDDCEGAEAVRARLFQKLLATYSSINRPQHGDNLTVDLTTGTFEHSGKWASAS
ncbi:hypothetical protein [Streptomyces sp. NPDC004267]|uniref:hypothetical protein n=1 Tax=Streptomyces sp. NPDC004267 TaxID=3364694 RepID=UPI0036AC0390